MQGKTLTKSRPAILVMVVKTPRGRGDIMLVGLLLLLGRTPAGFERAPTRIQMTEREHAPNNPIRDPA